MNTNIAVLLWNTKDKYGIFPGGSRGSNPFVCFNPPSLDVMIREVGRIRGSKERIYNKVLFSLEFPGEMASIITVFVMMENEAKRKKNCGMLLWPSDLLSALSEGVVRAVLLGHRVASWKKWKNDYRVPRWNGVLKDLGSMGVDEFLTEFVLQLAEKAREEKSRLKDFLYIQ